jgi:SAM-dependent methyltransferase
MKAVYDAIGRDYGTHRRPDPRIAAAIRAALGDAASVVNVGAGAGSYEPPDLDVVAVEPSRVMIAQRPNGASPAVQAAAEALPFPDGAFDAALAVLTLHHWADRATGLAELVRVARRRIVIVTWDPRSRDFWLTRDYLPAVVEIDAPIFPPLDELDRALGGARVAPLPVPHDCTDGFLGAYWRRPEVYLDPTARGAMSTFAKLAPEAVEPGIARLADDLASGRWDARLGYLRAQTEADLGYRLVIAERVGPTR